MNHHDNSKLDFGTSEKKLSIYLIGITICSLLTLLAFWVVMSGHFSKSATFVFIYSAAVAQFVVQLICFLRLNAQTKQGQTNVLALVFTLVILICIIGGSLWIMHNLGYHMMH